MGITRVLIVDDSSFVRKALRRIFEADPDTEVAGTAESGREALEMLRELAPDVVTLDIMMPGMDGLETLKAIMETRPTPVLMLSQLTKQDADYTLRALELGALDFVDKSATGMMDFFDLAGEITSKVKSITGAKPIFANNGSSGPAGPHSSSNAVDIVAVGASTGGPQALQMLLPQFPADISFALLIVQHMPRGFTGPLAKRLDTFCGIQVREAEDGEEIEAGTALIAPAGLHMIIEDRRAAPEDGRDPDGRKRLGKIKLFSGSPENMHVPSVDLLFESVAGNARDRAIGVLLTGMGSDGAFGLRSIRDKGGLTIAQDKGTSAIFGMPRVAIERDAAEMVLPITAIAGEVLKRA